MNILLVEPEFPIQPKSKNHCGFPLIGLLKLIKKEEGYNQIIYLIIEKWKTYS